MPRFKRLVVVTAVCGASMVHGAPVQSLSGTVYDPPPINYLGPGPISIAPNITWSASAKGYYGQVGYGFGENGAWPDLAMLGPDNLLDPGATARLDFARPVWGVGAFLNYAPNLSSEHLPATITAYDVNGHAIESFELTFLTNGGPNSGEFHGFLEDAPIIASLVLQGSIIGATHVTVVPEASVLWTMLLGIAAVVFAARRALRSR